MPLETSMQDKGVHSPTVRMNFLLVLTLVRVNMEEQVEDVKTFLRLIPIIVVGRTLAGAISVTSNFRDKLTELYTDLDVSESDLASSNTLTKCFQTASLTHTIYYNTNCITRTPSLPDVSQVLLTVRKFTETNDRNNWS